MPPFKLEDYEPVEERLARFWTDHPEGRVSTDLVLHEGKEWVVRAEVFRQAGDSHPVATGYAHEITGDGNVNRTSALENCETSAIGRALANAGYAPKGKRPSREEMAKAAAGVADAGAAGTTAPATPPAASARGRNAATGPARPKQEQADELAAIFERLYAAKPDEDWPTRADKWAEKQFGTTNLNGDQVERLLVKMRQQVEAVEKAAKA